MSPSHPSPSQARVLRRLRDGGCFTAPNLLRDTAGRTWYIGVRTVRAIERQGWIHSAPGQPPALSEAGALALRQVERSNSGGAW